VKPAVLAVVTVVAAVCGTAAATIAPAGAAKKLDVCHLVPATDLATAVGNGLDTPEDTTVGPIEGSCRFPSADPSGTDLNLFVSTNVKKSTKGLTSSFVGNEERFKRVYGSATPVPGVGKLTFTAFESGSVNQGALLVVDAKNHGVLVVLTGDGVTADNVVEHGKGVAALVLGKLK